MNEIQPKEIPIADFQRIRLAVDKGKNGESLPATRGHFSEKFYKRTITALHLAPSIVEHVLSMFDATGTSGDRVDSSPEASLPMNTQAFNDVNEVYSRLVYWCRLWAERLNRQAPGPAKHAWIAASNGYVVGLPVDITPANARYVVGIMSIWLELNLEDILGTNNFDDIEYFHDELAKDLFRLNAKWAQVAKPRYSEMPCPNTGCNGRVAIHPPQSFQDDEMIVCERCGFHIPPKRYEAHVAHYNRLQAESDPVKRHLMKKYLSA